MESWRWVLTALSFECFHRLWIFSGIKKKLEPVHKVPLSRTCIKSPSKHTTMFADTSDLKKISSKPFEFFSFRAKCTLLLDHMVYLTYGISYLHFFHGHAEMLRGFSPFPQGESFISFIMIPWTWARFEALFRHEWIFSTVISPNSNSYLPTFHTLFAQMGPLFAQTG